MNIHYSSEATNTNNNELFDSESVNTIQNIQQDDDYDFGGTGQDLFQEFSKLNLLNHFLGIEQISNQDKTLLIYEKILEEVTQSYNYLYS